MFLIMVNKALAIFEPVSGDESDTIGQMIPIRAPALTVEVTNT